MGAFRASAGIADLDPPVGGWMTGFGARVDPTTGVHDPIMARAVLLDDGATRLAVISCDLLGFTPAAVADMRSRVAASGAVPAANLMICCTHTHSGPTSMPMRGVLGVLDEQWLARAQAKIVDLVSGLAVDLAPAELAWGSAAVSGIGFNRQDNSRAVDEEMIAIGIERAGGGAIATLLNYATHAVVLGPGNVLYSGDFPGAAARHLDRLRGGVGLYLQGACGDVDPAAYLELGWGAGTFDTCEEIGGRLASAAAEALSGAPRTSDVKLDVRSMVVDVPCDPPPSEEALRELVQGLEADRNAAAASGDRVTELASQAMLAWADELGKRLRAGAVPGSVPAEVFAASINDLRLVGMPFETYTDIGLGIKEGLKPLKGVFCGYANGLWGYCPTGWAKDQGGYGAEASYRWFSGLVTAIGYGAAERLIAEATRLASSTTPPPAFPR